MNLRFVRQVLGFSLNGFGIFWASLNRFLCDSLCAGSCSNSNSNCFLLFLFVGIVFIICGYVIISNTLKKHKKIKKKTDWKKRFLKLKEKGK